MKKVCTKCGEEKDITEFYIQRYKNKIYYQSICKKCSSTQCKLYRLKHKTELIEKKKEYYQKNKKEINLWNKNYVKNNREKTNARMRCWWEKNKERLYVKKREISKRYYQNHLEQMRLKRIQHKEQMKLYRIEYQKINKNRMKEKNKRRSEILPDFYIASYFRPISVNELRKYPELIETKRLQIKINRELKKVNQN